MCPKPILSLLSIEKNISQELFETIEGYLNGSLSESDRLQFEAKLNSDPSLQEKIEEVRTILSNIETAVLKEKLDSFHTDIPVQLDDTSELSKNSKKSWYYVAGIAASIALLTALYFGVSGNTTPEKLFEEYFKPDPGLPTTMGTTTDFSFYEAMVDYKKGAYASAIEKWEALLPSKIKGDTLPYFLGVAHLANDNEEKAISYLHPLSQQGTTSFIKETDYYLGLAYLKANDIDNAKKLLASSGTQEALDLLAKLNE